MDLDEMKRAAARNEALREAADSAEARRVMETLDGASVENAIRRGDAAALKNAFAALLSTPEGRSLAARVQKAVERK